jgi:hypothetical protein
MDTASESYTVERSIHKVEMDVRAFTRSFEALCDSFKEFLANTGNGTQPTRFRARTIRTLGETYMRWMDEWHETVRFYRTKFALPPVPPVVDGQQVDRQDDQRSQAESDIAIAQLNSRIERAIDLFIDDLFYASQHWPSQTLEIWTSGTVQHKPSGEFVNDAAVGLLHHAVRLLTPDFVRYRSLPPANDSADGGDHVN